MDFSLGVYTILILLLGVFLGSREIRKDVEGKVERLGKKLKKRKGQVSGFPKKIDRINADIPDIAFNPQAYFDHNQNEQKE